MIGFQILTDTPENKLKDTICQRCEMMQEYNIALDASMTPLQYKSIVQHIKNQHGLVLLVVDVTDFPHSIVPDLGDIVGEKRPLYIVANKVDLLPQDSAGYLDRVKDMLVKECEARGLGRSHYLKHIALISAKTGYGVEDLITHLFKHWGKKGKGEVGLALFCIYQH